MLKPDFVPENIPCWFCHNLMSYQDAKDNFTCYHYCPHCNVKMRSFVKWKNKDGSITKDWFPAALYIINNINEMVYMFNHLQKPVPLCYIRIPTRKNPQDQSKVKFINDIPCQDFATLSLEELREILKSYVFS